MVNVTIREYKCFFRNIFNHSLSDIAKLLNFNNIYCIYFTDRNTYFTDTPPMYNALHSRQNILIKIELTKLILNLCYETYFFSWIICRYPKSTYLCNVFFIVLDLRLTKVGARRCSFFYVHTFVETLKSLSLP